MDDLSSKYGAWALITGSSSGIGKAFAYRLAELGLNVFLIARRKEILESVCNDISKRFNVSAEYLAFDLTSEHILETITKVTSDKEIGILVNNAGIGSEGEFSKTQIEYDNKLIILNCIAPAVLTHHFIEPMIQRKRGAVIFLGSILSYTISPFASVYSATKSFNSVLGETLNFELKKYGIDVLSLNPGRTKSEIKRVSKNESDLFERKPEQVVETALKALGKRPYVTDGLINKFAAAMTKIVPRKIAVNIAGKYVERIKKHEK
jgi:short-subunit dehydrogenase